MSRFTSFLLLSMLATAPASFTWGAGVERLTVDFDYVKSLAAERAANDYKPPEAPRLPRKLRDLDYNDYREIEFRADASLWGGEQALPFQLRFYHRGGANSQRVLLHETSATHVQEIPFREEFFNYRALEDPGRMRSDSGYAGFRVHYALNRPEAMDELVSFLGSSYFRALAPGNIYGLSARGLALDAALPGRAEEFPDFVSFWIRKPTADAESLEWFALLDSPSVAGAYAFTIDPGHETVMTVRVALYWRNAVADPGWAPLTSMFWFGENSDRPANTLRPEVHDSDGLWIETADAGRQWQPLQRVAHARITDIPTSSLRGFGLIQRDRAFANYQDLEAGYHRRPSAWVEPLEDWGPGQLRLSELPTDSEYHDNVVAYWRPDQPVAAGDESHFSYRLIWGDQPPPASLAQVTATRHGHDGEGRPMWWVDFAGENLAQLAPSDFGADLQIGGDAEVVHQALEALPDGAGWRVIIVTNARPTAGLTCTLRQGPDAISETWRLPTSSS
ncbi:glucan biosynthesis protein [Actomonas aquatica]|uniref:Glucan biosynthesis protein n=1 Tax=Actomonas aquatica TaxID=2866162 RepID=A0ABZ1C5S4_9BACT|nr:glucan biosynthesis protein [Opitutus sp. WL0086]WRQ86762.1 glucan biosynthesis protein [Opitutus sp. WL0086]